MRLRPFVDEAKTCAWHLVGNGADAVHSLAQAVPPLFAKALITIRSASANLMAEF
jgi:hypothetical protein